MVPKLRHFVVGWIRRLAHEAFGVLRGLHSPRRLAMLFGGNLVAELLFASTLGIFVLAFGYSVPLQELLFINICVSLLSGLIPVPGGIGVTEGGLIFGLTSVGHAAGGGVRGGDALPAGHVLPAADLGLLLAPVARRNRYL